MSSDKRRSEQAADSLLAKHPAQRIEAPSRNLSLLLHGGGLCSFAYSFYFLIANPNAISEAYGWHFQFLTIIGLLLAALTFSVAFLADVTLSSRLFVVKNALSVASAPLESLISILYWGLSLIDPHLVKPENLPPLPLHADLGLHAAPAALLTLDILFFSPPWSISAVPAMCLSGAIAVGYWFWVDHCHAQNGFYPYPIFDVSTPLRAGLFAASAAVMTLSTFTMKALYRYVNGTRMREAIRKSSGSMNGSAMNGLAKKAQ